MDVHHLVRDDGSPSECVDLEPDHFGTGHEAELEEATRCPLATSETGIAAWWRGRLGEREAGMVTAFVVVFTLALLVMAGLVLDGGLALSAKMRAIDDAQAAARAGAQAVDIPLYRSTGQITLDRTEATADAEQYLAQAGRHGSVTVDGDQVTVTVIVSQPTQLLSLAGVDHLTVSGSGSATAEQAGP